MTENALTTGRRSWSLTTLQSIVVQMLFQALQDLQSLGRSAAVSDAESSCKGCFEIGKERWLASSARRVEGKVGRDLWDRTRMDDTEEEIT
jgi:hypothetical protein